MCAFDVAIFFCHRLTDHYSVSGRYLRNAVTAMFTNYHFVFQRSGFCKDPESEIRGMVQRHVSRSPVGQTQHSYLQPQAGAAGHCTRKRAGQIRILGGERSVHIHHFQPH